MVPSLNRLFSPRQKYRLRLAANFLRKQGEFFTKDQNFYDSVFDRILEKDLALQKGTWENVDFVEEFEDFPFGRNPEDLFPQIKKAHLAK